MAESFSERLELEEARSGQATSLNNGSLISESRRPNGIENKSRAAIFVGLFLLLFLAIGVIVYIAQHLSNRPCKINFCSKVLQPKDGNCNEATCEECMPDYKASHDGGVSYCAPKCENVIELCEEVSVPRGIQDCSDSEVTCTKCAMWNLQQTFLKTDSKGEYCALACPISHCKTVSVPRGKVANCISAEVTCEEADEGYVPMRDHHGAYAGKKCELARCSNYTIAREATDCTDAICSECVQGSHFDRDDKWILDKKKCINSCTDDQIRRGCAAFSCSDAKTCSKCAPGFNSNGTACKKASSPTLMEFYMYRASREAPTSDIENVGTASAAGVLWYLQNSVVSNSCIPPHLERKNNITRIQRFKVKVKNTQQVYDYDHDSHIVGHHLLGHYAQFEEGHCTNCNTVWDKLGYHVGVQMTTYKSGSMGVPYYESRYSNALWYSLPGRCPEKRWNDPAKQECAKTRPGGACRNASGDNLPTGTNTCTWQIEDDVREVSIDELTGITDQYADYKAFCKADKKEYDRKTDRGEGLSWWDNRKDDEANAERTRLLLAKFAEKYPEDPVLLDPIYDGFTIPQPSY